VLVVPEPGSIGAPPPVLAVVYCKKKPCPATEASVLNFIHRVLPEDCIGSGMAKPQYRPIIGASEDSPFRICKPAYFSLLYKNDKPEE